VAAREAVAAVARVGFGAVDLEDAGDRLLLEPLPRVPLVGPGRARNLRRRRLTRLGKRPVQAQALPQVDGQNLERAERSGRKPLGERISLRGLRRSGRRPS
jgi:hypothetical protein